MYISKGYIKSFDVLAINFMLCMLSFSYICFELHDGKK